MALIPDLQTRSFMPERMDDPCCSTDMLLRTVRQFASINRLVSRYRTLLKRWILADMLRAPARPYHLVDMGAGGCDIDIWLLGETRRRGLDLRITACDLDPRIIAQARSVHGHVDGLAIRQVDVLVRRPEEPVDYVFANHFLHHLSREEIIRLLRFWHPHVRGRLLFSDLERNLQAYLGYSALSLFYRKSFARYDGLVSIRRGFTPLELGGTVAEALPGAAYRVDRLMPGRLALCIDGPGRHAPGHPEYSPFIPKKH